MLQIFGSEPYRGGAKMPVCEKIDDMKALPLIVPYNTPQEKIDRLKKLGYEVKIGKKLEEDKNDNNKG